MHYTGLDFNALPRDIIFRFGPDDQNSLKFTPKNFTNPYDYHTMEPILLLLNNKGLLKGPDAQSNFISVVTHPSLAHLGSALEVIAHAKLLDGPMAQHNFLRLVGHPDLRGCARLLPMVQVWGLLDGVPKPVSPLLKTFSKPLRLLDSVGLLSGHLTQENFDRAAGNVEVFRTFAKLMLSGAQAIEWFNGTSWQEDAGYVIDVLGLAYEPGPKHPFHLQLSQAIKTGALEETLTQIGVQSFEEVFALIYMLPNSEKSGLSGLIRDFFKTTGLNTEVLSLAREARVVLDQDPKENPDSYLKKLLQANLIEFRALIAQRHSPKSAVASALVFHSIASNPTDHLTQLLTSQLKEMVRCYKPGHSPTKHPLHMEMASKMQDGTLTAMLLAAGAKSSKEALVLMYTSLDNVKTALAVLIQELFIKLGGNKDALDLCREHRFINDPANPKMLAEVLKRNYQKLQTTVTTASPPTAPI